MEMLGRAEQAYERSAAALSASGPSGWTVGERPWGNGRGLWGGSSRSPGFEASGGEALAVRIQDEYLQNVPLNSKGF